MLSKHHHHLREKAAVDSPVQHASLAQQKQFIVDDQPQFVSPRRKRMASQELVNSHHLHLNQSEITEPGNISFQTVTSAGTASSLAGGHLALTATSLRDISSDTSRLYAFSNPDGLDRTQPHPSLAHHQHHNSSLSSSANTSHNTSHIQQTLFLSPDRNTNSKNGVNGDSDIKTAPVMASPVSTISSPSGVKNLQPAALFTLTADAVNAKKSRATHHKSSSSSNDSGRFDKIRMNIFNQDDEVLSPEKERDSEFGNDADMSTGCAIRSDDDGDNMLGDDDDVEFLSRGNFDPYRPRYSSSSRDDFGVGEQDVDLFNDPSTEHFDRLESDTSMNRHNSSQEPVSHTKQFPRQSGGSANSSLISIRMPSISRSQSGERVDREHSVPASPTHSQGSIQSQGSGFQTAVRRSSRASVAARDLEEGLAPQGANNNHDHHHRWLTENVNNFSRSCDLYATSRRERDHDVDDSAAANITDFDLAVPPSPVKHTKRSPANYDGLSHQVLFPSSPGALGTCTPVTEAGSPAVLDDIEYPEGGDDSMIMDISYESTSSRQSGSSGKGTRAHHHGGPHRSLFDNDPIERDIREYDIFARGVIHGNGSDSVEKPVTKVRRKSKVMDSPSGVHAMADLSSTSLTSSMTCPPSSSAMSVPSQLHMSLFNSFDGQNQPGSGPPSFLSESSTHYGHNQHSLGSIATVSSGASCNRSNIPRPLPDPAAFDNAVSTKIMNSSFEHNPSSPVCPATPSRTPAAWHHSHNSSHHHSAAPPSVSSTSLVNEADSDFLSITVDHNSHGDDFLNAPSSMHAPPPLAPPLLRQNSLYTNKVLLSAQSGSPRGDVLFQRDFVIEGMVGTGTFAEVYKVRSYSPYFAPTVHEGENEDGDDHDEHSNDVVQSGTVGTSVGASSQYFAVKKLKRQFRSKKDRDWLLNEVRIMKQVNRIPCPYVIPFVRAWQEDNFFYVQLGYAEKGTLKDLAHSFVVKKETIPTRTLWHVAHDISAGLKHIHAENIVHLDIKPANVLINAKGILQIGDFGMASTKGSKDDSHEGDTR